LRRLTRRHTRILAPHARGARCVVRGG
jgi:hypothetical protein